MSLPLDRKVVEALNLGNSWPDDARQRLAESYYADGLLSLGQAARMAGIPYPDFVARLRKRHIAVDYDPRDLADDVEQLKALGLWDGSVGQQR